MAWDENGRWVPERRGEPRRADEFSEGTADIPLLGWLFGSQARRDAARGEGEADRNRAYWEDLAGSAPSADDLAVDYEQEGDIAYQGDMREGVAGAYGGGFGEAAQRRALAQMERLYQEGGLTGADRAMMDSVRRAQEQAARGQREAIVQQANARGMGGSGTSLLAQMQGSDAAQSRAADFDAQMAQAAQQRAFQAMQASAGLGGQMRGQGFDEDVTRRSAIDDFNQRQTEYARGREHTNVGLRNRSRESRRDANQQAYENRTSATSGMTGQYGADQSRRQWDQRRQDETNQAGASALGTILTEVF